MSAPVPPPVRAQAGSQDARRACPYCRAELQPGVHVVRCGACQAVHHADCWGANQGCAMVACIAGPSPATAGQPAAASHGVSGGARQRLVLEFEPARHASWLAIAVVLLVLALVIAGAAIVFASSVPAAPGTIAAARTLEALTC